MATAPPVFMGIDVAKAALVVAARPTNESWVDDEGIEGLLRRPRRADQAGYIPIRIRMPAINARAAITAGGNFLRSPTQPGVCEFQQPEGHPRNASRESESCPRYFPAVAAIHP